MSKQINLDGTIDADPAVAPKAPTAHAVAYDAALETFRAASRKYTVTSKAYHAREIGDAEFLAAKAAFKLAQVACDVAETNFINACNETGEI
jgi:hypothetical protein